MAAIGSGGFRGGGCRRQWLIGVSRVSRSGPGNLVFLNIEK